MGVRGQEYSNIVTDFTLHTMVDLVVGNWQISSWHAEAMSPAFECAGKTHCYQCTVSKCKKQMSKTVLNIIWNAGHHWCILPSQIQIETRVSS
jgi:hypothetical protein